MKAAAVILWVLAWGCAGFIPAAWFAAINGKRGVARAELAIGIAGAAGLGWAGAVTW